MSVTSFVVSMSRPSPHHGFHVMSITNSIVSMSYQSPPWFPCHACHLYHDFHAMPVTIFIVSMTCPSPLSRIPSHARHLYDVTVSVRVSTLLRAGEPPFPGIQRSLSIRVGADGLVRVVYCTNTLRIVKVSSPGQTWHHLHGRRVITSPSVSDCVILWSCGLHENTHSNSLVFLCQTSTHDHYIVKQYGCSWVKHRSALGSSKILSFLTAFPSDRTVPSTIALCQSTV